MTEPSIETAEGRASLRKCMTSEDWDWSVWLEMALDALDARDAALAEARAAERERCARVADSWADSRPGNTADRIAEDIRALRDPGT